jgi:LPXTG-site transpeptidase (sortase) family protein
MQILRSLLIAAGTLVFAVAMSGPAPQTVAMPAPQGSLMRPADLVPSLVVPPLPSRATPTGPMLPANAPLAREAETPDGASEAEVQAAFPTPAWPRRLVMPYEGIDAPVESLGVVAGSFEIPAWAVGHWEASATPTEPGNGVYYGHVESVTDGNVFAALPLSEIGSLVFVDTDDSRFVYEVRATSVVPRSDTSVLLPLPGNWVTLITCIGTFIPRERDYTHRFIVQAELLYAEPLA